MAEEKKEPKVELPLAESRGAIFGIADDTVYDFVDVPEWSCRIRVRSLTATELSDYETSLWRADKDGKPVRNKEATRQGRGKLCALAVVDGKGARLFVDDDAGELSRKNAAAVDRIATRILELSGKGEKAVEEEEGN